VNGLQFSMVSLAAHQVSGVLVDETGSPLAGAIRHADDRSETGRLSDTGDGADG